jgi:hypothetical protein
MLQSQSIVVTGAASGLGLAISRQLTSRGCRVAMIDNDSSRLAPAVTSLGTNATGFACDITDADQVDRTCAELANWSPTIDVLINNAGVWTDNELETVDPARRKLAFDTNVVGNIQMTTALLPTLTAQDSAHIFNVISVSADIVSPSNDNRLWSTYGATKWALAGYTKTLREQLANTNVRVSGFFPAGIDTNFYENAGKSSGIHDEPWMMDPNDIADIVLFMLSRPAGVHIESLTVVKA